MRFTAQKRTSGYTPSRPRKRRLSFVRIIAVSILAVFLMSVVMVVILFVRSATLPSKTHIGLALYTDPALFLFIDTETDTAVAITVPTDSYVEVPRGFGSYRLSASWRLGEIEGISGQLYAETMQELLAVPVDAWIGFGHEPIPIDSDFSAGFGDVVSRLGVSSFILDGMTNLSLIDRIYLRIVLSQTAASKTQFVALADTDAISDITLADKSTVRSIDTERLDTYITDMFEYSDVREEGLTIEVLNATSRSFLGTRAERMITHLGGRVVRVGNADEETDECIIKGEKSIAESKTVRVIQSQFHCLFIDVPDGGIREDMQVIIGKRYQEALFGAVPKN